MIVGRYADWRIGPKAQASQPRSPFGLAILRVDYELERSERTAVFLEQRWRQRGLGPGAWIVIVAGDRPQLEEGRDGPDAGAIAELDPVGHDRRHRPVGKDLERPIRPYASFSFDAWIPGLYPLISRLRRRASAQARDRHRRIEEQRSDTGH